MSALIEVTEALRSALGSIEGLRVYSDLSGSISPPGAVLRPPTLSWESPCSDPTSAEFEVAIVVAANERAEERLFALLPKVATAVDSVQDAVVVSARPGAYSNGGSSLPMYAVTINCSLY